MPDLSRPTATPGHGAKMSMIFRDAATSLQGGRLPPHQLSSNIKKTRLPLSQARSIRFGSTCQDDTMVSSGLGDPPKIGQHSGESCEREWALSEATRYRVSGIRTQCSTPIPLTKADLANERLGAAAGLDGMCLAKTPRISSAFSPLEIEEEVQEPISSGFATPIAPSPDPVKDPEELKYPTLENWRSIRPSSNASSLGSDSDDLHSTHGVPLTLPLYHSDADEAPRSDIDTWLNGIMEATTPGLASSPKQPSARGALLMNDSPLSRSVASNRSSPRIEPISPTEFKQDMQSPSRASSNKENFNPLKNLSSPTHHPAPRFQLRIPFRFCQTNNQPTFQHIKTPNYAHPLTPQGHLSLPPRRKRPRVDGIVSSGAETEIPKARRDFTIRMYISKLLLHIWA